MLSFQLALMFVVMTVHAQQFPVTTIGGIVAVIVIAVMHSQLMQILVSKLARTATANMWVHLQREFTITRVTRFTGAP